MAKILTILMIVLVAVLSGCSAEDKTPLPKAQYIEANVCVTPRAATAITEGVMERFQPGLKEIAGIEEIKICEDLTFRGIPVPAAAINSDGKTVIYVDARAPLKIDVSFTHELFHAIEFQYPVDEDAWAQINPYESYMSDTASPGEIVRYTPNMTPAFEPGFVSDYARFSGMEDRAELFTALYSGRELRPKERAALMSDTYLLKKITFLKGYLENAGLVCGLEDNLFLETNFTCSLYKLTRPELVRTGPTEAYPPAKLIAGQVLADSGFEKDGIKMLYDCESGFRRVYAPPSALEPLESTTLCVFPK